MCELRKRAEADGANVCRERQPFVNVVGRCRATLQQRRQQFAAGLRDESVASQFKDGMGRILQRPADPSAKAARIVRAVRGK